MWWWLLACSPETPVLVSALEAQRPVVAAHRGGDDLAPESTVEAYQRAWEAGAHILEMDIRRSADGVLYLFHDETLDRTTDGEGEIDALTYDELASYDAGYWWTEDDGETYPWRGQGLTIPTLEEVFAAVPDGVFNLDIKSREVAAIDETVALVDAFDLRERVCVGSFDDAVGLALQAELPEACTYTSEGFGRWRILGDLLPTDAPASPRFHILEVPVSSAGIRVVDAAFVRRAHARDQQVWVWTVNTQDEMEELLQIGVDGFITDEVALAVEVSEAW